MKPWFPDSPLPHHTALRLRRSRRQWNQFLQTKVISCLHWFKKRGGDCELNEVVGRQSSVVVGGWRVKKAGWVLGGIVCGRRLRVARGKAAPRVSGRARNAAGASKSCTFAFTSLPPLFTQIRFHCSPPLPHLCLSFKLGYTVCISGGLCTLSLSGGRRWQRRDSLNRTLPDL